MLGENLHGSSGPVRDPFSLQEVCEDRGHNCAPGNVVWRIEHLPPRHDRVTCPSERRCAPRAHRTGGPLVWEGRRTGRRAGRSGWWSEGPLHAPCAMAYLAQAASFATLRTSKIYAERNAIRPWSVSLLVACRRAP